MLIQKHQAFYGNTNNNNSISFQFKQQITRQTENNGTKFVKIMVPLKYLSNIWITLEMSLINCEIRLILTLSKNCFLVLQQIRS